MLITLAGILASAVAVMNGSMELWIASQSLFQGLERPFHREAIVNIIAFDNLGMQIHNRREIEPTFLSWQVSDVGHKDFISPWRSMSFEQIGVVGAAGRSLTVVLGR